MIEAMLTGFGYLDVQILMYLTIGVVVSQIMAVIPGLGGIFSMVLLMPFALSLDPMAAIAMLVGAAVTSGTGNSVTAILFGVPGSPTGIATIFDGYPMTQQGQAARALGAALGSSALGGFIGAFALALMIPVIRPIALALGPAEFFVLIVIALIMLAGISSGDTLKALSAGSLGVLVSSVGQDLGTGTARYTFGELYLYDGVNLLAFLIGFYAISEMMILMRRTGSISQTDTPPVESKSGTMAGLRDCWTYRRAVVQSSLIGTGIGAVPGLGGDAAAFLAYASVARTSKNKEMFGRGAVEGVIAADASQNSKEGGALLPTLALGIPGSAGMAVLLVAFVTLGISPGPDMMTTHLDIVWLIVWVLVAGSLLATLITLPLVGLFAKLTFLRNAMIVPAVMVIALFGAFSSTRSVGDLYLAIAAGVLGYIMVRLGFSRVVFIVAFVLGPMLEKNLSLSVQIYGGGMFLRPGVIGLIMALAISIVFSRVRKRQRDQV